MNRGWIEQNKATAEKFILSLVQANDLIEKDRPAAAKMVAKFLKMPLELATELMPKVEFDMTWTERSIESIQVSEQTLAEQKKLKAPLDYTQVRLHGPAEESPPGERQVNDPSGEEVATHPLPWALLSATSRALESGPLATLGARACSAE